ncbi:metalloregulator ArsR/SmtB family transcription factor [Herpetosiphon gulosus]|uniref:HTH arsR-type domain-containing protein n=1 Tax=Herpetosiphon gulosus TaxID=1973496 RepID=A0ABP9WX85_9CHLR
MQLQTSAVADSLNTLQLLNRAATIRGASAWVQRTAQALSAKELADNQLVASLSFGLLPQNASQTMDEFLAELGSTEPNQWVAQIQQHLLELSASTGPLTSERLWQALRNAGIYSELATQQELLAAMQQPAQLLARVCQHLEHMWQTWFKAEWQQAQTAISQLNRQLQAQVPNEAALKGFRQSLGYAVNQEWQQLQEQRQIVLFAAIQNGSLTTFLADRQRLWVGIGFGMSNELQPRIISRNELLFRLQALADAARIQIMELLAQGELSAQAIISQTQLPQSSVSRHLNILRNAGFVQERRAGGATKSYRLVTSHIGATFAALEQALNQASPSQISSAQSESAVPASIQRFFNREGRMVTWPSKHIDRIPILAYFAAQFELGREYSEREINEVLKPHTGSDVANLRRYLIDVKLFERDGTGSRYWRKNEE